MLEVTYIIVTILIIPCFIFGIYAQVKVNSTFNNFKSLEPINKITTQEATTNMLTFAVLNDVKVGEVKGNLTDNYNPKTKTINLSQSTRTTTSVAGIGVIAHEIGHAIQHKEGYLPLKIRNTIVPFANFGSIAFYPLFIIGFILIFVPATTLVGEILVWVATALYFLSTLFYLITLPVERNASKRAINLLRESGTLSEEDIAPAKKVLKAAELTYVSALLTSLVYFLRFFIYVLALVKKD